MVELEKVPFASTIKRHVLLVGSTGRGKTTICNMLQNNGISKQDCTQPNQVGHGAGSCTKKPHLVVIPDRDMVLLDTVGLGDPEMSNDEILRQLTGIFTSSRTGLTSIILVASFKRWSREERMNVQAMDEIFEKDWKKHSVLVLTHYEGDIGRESQEIAEWSKDTKVKEFLANFSRVIVTDNNVRRLEESCRPLRQRCLMELNEAIASMDLSKPVAIRSRSIWDVIQHLCELYSSMYGMVSGRMRTTHEALRLACYAGSLSGSPSGGMCAICLDDIPLDRMSTTACKHTFHQTCIEEHWDRSVQNRQSPACPKCRASIRTIFVYNESSRSAV